MRAGQLVTEEFYALGKLVQLGLGTRNYDGNTTLCMSTAVAGYKRSLGSDSRPPLEDLEVADVVLLIGANIARRSSHPVPSRAWNKDRTLIVVDPRVSQDGDDGRCVFSPSNPAATLRYSMPSCGWAFITRTTLSGTRL